MAMILKNSGNSLVVLGVRFLCFLLMTHEYFFNTMARQENAPDSTRTTQQ